jgi:ABC-type glycerol-3-phosphate transport system substrate-binding protein
MMAKRWLVAAVLLLLPLGGCGNEPEAEPATVPVPATSSAAAVPSRTAVAATRTPTAQAARQAEKKAPGGFVAVVQREVPGLAMDHRDEEIAAIAEQACAALAAGRSAGAVVAGVRTYGTDRATARKLIRLAIETVCPEQDRRADDF